MKDEIKEILDYCKKYVESKDENRITSLIDIYLEKLLDYITNLQDRTKELEQINEEHRLLNGMLREENNKLKKLIITLQKNIMELDCSDEELELLNSILQGKSDE